MRRGDLLGKTEFALRDAVLKLGAQTLEGAVNEQAEQQIALSDGAVCLEKFLKTHFPQAVLILDFFHAAEHLAELA